MSLLDTASLIVTPNGYKAGTLYSVIPSNGNGDFTVTRATTATRTNSSGLIESVATGVPRLDYSSGSCPSLLVEPQRTNILLRSQEFDNATWTKVNTSVTANNTTSPDGTANAEKLSATISTVVTPAEILQSTSQLGSTTYSYSVYAKKSTSNFIALRHTGVSGNPYAWFNLNTGTIGTVQSGITAKIQSIGNGWYRCTIVGTTPAVVVVNRVDMIVSDNDANYVCAINGSIFIWGSQLEVGAYASSYIPTTTASVTRNADVISKTGISSLIGQTEGTFFFDGIVNGCQNSSANILNSERNTTASFFIGYIKSTNRIAAGIYSSATEPATFQGGSVAIGSRFKVAYAYKSGSSTLYVNGVQIGTSSTTFTLPSTIDDLYISDQTTFFSFGESVTNNVTSVWKTRLTNTQLEQLTTI